MSDNTEQMLLGTSGWSYKEWIGPFYSKEDKSMLRAYTKVFKTVEIDSTFYRYPSKGMVMGWTRYSPEDFIFAAKLPRLITHDKKLDLGQGAESDLEKFIELMEPLALGGKLGCLLIQLPPRFTYQPEVMESFFKVLPTHIRFAVEFRHHSWMREETWKLLEKYKVAYTIVDEPLLPPEIHITSHLAYVRWHGHGSKPWYNYRYDPEQLEPWVPKLNQAKSETTKVLGYFNNHYHGHAVENCLQVLKMLGPLTPSQAAAKTKVDNYFKNLGKTAEYRLDAFAEPRAMEFEELLRYFVAAGRLERARHISDKDLTITLQNDKRIEANVKEYTIILDIEDKTVAHDCADWEKILSTKKLCKHLAKLLLQLGKKEAQGILESLYKEKEQWRFGPCTKRQP